MGTNLLKLSLALGALGFVLSALLPTMGVLMLCAAAVLFVWDFLLVALD